LRLHTKSENPKNLTMEVKIQAFHRQLFKKSITLLEFRERQAVRICIYLTAKVCYLAEPYFTEKKVRLKK